MKRVGLVVFVMMLGLVSMAQPSRAAADLIIPRDADGNVVVQVTIDDGKLSGEIPVVNLSSKRLDVTITDVRSAGACRFAGDRIPPESSSTIEIVSDPCRLDRDAGSVVVAVAGSSSPKIIATLKPAAIVERVALVDLVWPFTLGALLAFFGILLVWLRHRPEAKNASAVGAGETNRLRWKDVADFPPDWSFRDSWASNISVVATLFVAIFGSSETLTALLGKGAEQLFPQLVLVVATAGLFVGLAPLALKLFGPPGTFTVGGLLLGSFLTFTGVAGQLVATYWIFEHGRLTPRGVDLVVALGEFPLDLGTTIAVGLLAFLVIYSYRTVMVLLREAAKPEPPVAPSSQLLTASALTMATRGENVTLDGAHLTAEAYLKWLGGRGKVGDDPTGDGAEAARLRTQEQVTVRNSIPLPRELLVNSGLAAKPARRRSPIL